LSSGLFLSIGEYSVLWFIVGVGFAFAKISASARTSGISDSVSMSKDRSVVV
jgi:hypothetical protein